MLLRLHEPTEQYALTPDRVERYHRDGFLGPFSLCSPKRMAAWRPAIEQALAPDPDSELPWMIKRLGGSMQHGFGRHHDNSSIYDLVTHPGLIGRMASILGEDLLLWRSMFFVKEPGAQLIPWHQDYDEWPIEPFLIISAWIAIDEATPENGCVELIPGSHRSILPLVTSPDGCVDGFPNMTDPRLFDDSNMVRMELKPGEFFLFNERVLHRSAPNASDKRRMGLAVRCIPPLVRILDPNDRAILVSGEDRLGFNALVDAPQS